MSQQLISVFRGSREKLRHFTAVIAMQFLILKWDGENNVDLLANGSGKY